MNDCVICYEHIHYQKYICIYCNNHFHQHCIKKWFDNNMNNNHHKCPYCMNELILMNLLFNNTHIKYIFDYIIIQLYHTLYNFCNSFITFVLQSNILLLICNYLLPLHHIKSKYELLDIDIVYPNYFIVKEIIFLLLYYHYNNKNNNIINKRIYILIYYFIEINLIIFFRTQYVS